MAKRRAPQSRTNRKHTTDTINAGLKIVGRGVVLVSEYKGDAKIWLKFRCEKEGHEFESTVNSALYAGRGCPKCDDYKAPERKGREIIDGRARNRSFFKIPSED